MPTEDRSHRPQIFVRGFDLLTLAVWIGYALYSNLTARFSLDLRVFRAAGSAFFADKNVYALHFTSYRLPFTYPPFALLALSPVSLPPVHIVEALWWLADCACLVYLVHFGVTTVGRTRFAYPWRLSLLLTPVLALLLEPLRRNTTYGQVNIYLLLLVVADLAATRARGRGCLVGLAAAIKLTPMIYIFVFLFRRDWRAACQCVGAFVAASLVGLAVLPSASKVYWTHFVFDPSRTGSVTGAVNQALYGLVRRWPFDNTTPEFVWIIVAALTLLIGVWLSGRLIRRDDLGGAILALGLTSESVSPVSWSHHWVWLALLPFLLVRLVRSQQRLIPGLMLLLLIVAALGPYSWGLSGAPGHFAADSLIGVGCLLLYAWGVVEVLAGRIMVVSPTELVPVVIPLDT